MICAKNYENIFKFVKVTHAQNTVDSFFRTRCIFNYTFISHMTEPLLAASSLTGSGQHETNFLIFCFYFNNVL